MGRADGAQCAESDNTAGHHDHRLSCESSDKLSTAASQYHWSLMKTHLDAAASRKKSHQEVD